MGRMPLFLAVPLLVALVSGTIAVTPVPVLNTYQIRPDLRRCVSPLCGGYFVKRVNRPRSRCADGQYRAECYVAEADWSPLGLSVEEQRAFLKELNSGRVLVGGTIEPKQFGSFGNLGLLVATEGWLAASAALSAGGFFRIYDNGIRCITTPCFSFQESKLNSKFYRDISDLDLRGVGADPKMIAAAMNAVANDSILVAGENRIVPHAGPAGDGVALVAAQFWLRVGPGGER